MTTIEKIAQEVVLLDVQDVDSCKRVADMLIEFSESKAVDDEIRIIADEASKLCAKLAESGKFEEDMQKLSQFIDTLQKHEESADRSDAPAVIDDEMVKEFLQKQEITLQEFEEYCLEFEKGNTEQFAALKRQIHTWKGESAILGYQDLSNAMHQIEDALESLPKEEYSRIPDALLELKDILSSYFESTLRNEKTTLQGSEEIIRKLRTDSKADAEVKPEFVTVEATPEDSSPKDSDESFQPREFVIPDDVDLELVQEFRSESDEHIQNSEVALMALENDPSDMDSVNIVFRAFHTIKGVSSFIGVDYITNMAHKAENFLDRVRKGQLLLEGPYTDIAFEALDMLKSLIATLDQAIENGKYTATEKYFSLKTRLQNPESISGGTTPSTPRSEPLGKILVDEGKSSPEAIEQALRKQTEGDQRPLGELLVENKAARAADIVQAVRSQNPVGNSVKVKRGETTVKVSTTRLDNLINSVGELVIAQSMVSQDPEIQNTASQKLVRNVSQLAKITRSLQELALSMRMVSVKPTFQKMARLVRDLARKSNKNVAFEMVGEDTELDRNMVEAIADPLVHMVRNAVDHGIEPTADRVRAGKPEQGAVTLSAAHEGGSVVITLRDNGKGLNKEKIFAKAVERGLMEANAQLSDSDMYNLIFQPGFSTADKVTDVSGRGVGMDVVRTNIEKLRGSVIIESSPGEGSLFKIRLPLTLAIIDGMVIRVGSQRYIIPTVTITESFRPSRDSIVTVKGRNELVSLRGELIPISRLHHIFDISDARKQITEGILIVAEGKGRRVALMADELLGQQQVVIKRLGDVFKDIQAVSGGAILGDGMVSLILDVEGIIQTAAKIASPPVSQYLESKEECQTES